MRVVSVGKGTPKVRYNSAVLVLATSVCLIRILREIRVCSRAISLLVSICVGPLMTKVNNTMSARVTTAAAKTVNINVTEYSPVGEHIRGTFEGTFQSGSGPVTITEGKFCVTRQPDHEE